MAEMQCKFDFKMSKITGNQSVLLHRLHFGIVNCARSVIFFHFKCLYSVFILINASKFGVQIEIFDM